MNMEFEGMVKQASIPSIVEAGRREWIDIALSCREKGGRLVSLWGSERDGFHIHAAYVFPEGMVVVRHPVEGKYASLSGIFPCATRMQRAVYDMLGIDCDAEDRRPWLSHGIGPLFPSRKNPGPIQERGNGDYPFVAVEGEGVHEVAVGPVHAGIIEPGHFRFQVVGEKVLRLEERLGYKHKGIEKQFEGMTLKEGAELAGRISGDSTVAYSWAYAMAAESVCRAGLPERAGYIRAILLERERIANHLADLGALGNDAGFAFGLSQFSIIREDMLRINKAVFGHRLLMDLVAPGGVSKDLEREDNRTLLEECASVRRKVGQLREIYADHTGLQDRFLTTGRVAPDLAAGLGLTGLAGRASRNAFDIRVDHPHFPYDRLEVAMATHHGGDVAARVSVRFDEIFESLRLIEAMLEIMPEGEFSCDLKKTGGSGMGWVEGFRGEVFIFLEIEEGLIRRAHAHDPSWQNWPALEFAVIGNIVPDFPLINKSFNLSYSGHDL